MALICKKTTSCGVDASYHRIIEMTVSYALNAGVVIVGSYVNETARRKGSTPVETIPLTFDYAALGGAADIRAAIYTRAMDPAEVTVDNGDGTSVVRVNALSGAFPGAVAG